MPRKGLPKERYQPSTYVPQPPTFVDKPIYSLMTSEERDKRLNILLNKEEKTQKDIDIADAEAKTNSEAREHNKNEIRKLDSKKNEMGIVERACSIFGVGPIHSINEKIEYLQSEQAKLELHDQELFEKVRESVLEQEEIMRSKNDINRMYRDSRNDNTDGHRLSLINANYFLICKFIERYVTNFTLKKPFTINKPYEFALMHALANEVSIQYFGNNCYKEPTDALYEHKIDDDMLKATFDEMNIFKNENNLKAFLEQARRDEKDKQREKRELSRQQQDAHNKALSSRLKLSLVPPEECKNKGEKRKRDVEDEDEDEDKNNNKSKSRIKKETGGGRRHRRTRKSKK